MDFGKMNLGEIFGTSFGITFAVLLFVIFLIFIALYPQYLLNLVSSLLEYIRNLVLSLLAYIRNLVSSLFKNNQPLPGADNCAIIPGDTEAVSRLPSAYLAHVAFFFTFIFTNAYYVYKEEKKDDTSSTQYDNRRYRSLMIMGTVVALYLIIVFARYNITGCDSSLGVLYTTFAFGALGFGTYKLAEICGARTADILGISSSYVPDTAEAPLACGK